jgi:acetyltransferase-like isoleucine patch superfamily enzyme
LKIKEECNDKIEIGSDVWIGANVVIKNGVKIGNGAIIGAGSVVIKDIDQYSINVGVPSKKIKSRFNFTQIEELENLKWYDLEIETLANKIKSDERFQCLKTYLTYRI